MVTFLFWNLNRKPLTQSVANLAKHHNVDVVVLAECSVPPELMLSCLNDTTGVAFSLPFSICKKITIYSRYSRTFFRPVTESRRTTIQRVSLPLKPDFLLGGVHFPSQRDFSKGSLAMEIQQFMSELTSIEHTVEHKRTVVVGDFNLNPFDEGMVGASAMNAVMTREIALRGSRKVQDRSYSFFYNPMWSHFGDGKTGPAGTYYYDKAEHVNYYWNIFDQVLIRPELLEYFGNENIQILTTDGNKPLISARGLPDTSTLSDHLPVLFTMNL